MIMSRIWTGMILCAILAAAEGGREPELAQAVLEGAGSAVRLCLSLLGPICLWCGVMEVMERSGLAEALARLLRPILARLYPQTREDGETMSAIAANVSANLLGLGSAATPMGIRAAQSLAKGSHGAAGDGLCMLVVCNSASIQLIPATVAAVRAGAGCATPFDILPAVWLTSTLSVGTGILACLLLRRIWRA